MISAELAFIVLVGGLGHVLFFLSVGNITSIDFHVSQRGGSTHLNPQPAWIQWNIDMLGYPNYIIWIHMDI